VSKKQQTSSTYFKSLQTKYFALIAGQVFFGAVLIFVNLIVHLDYKLPHFGDTLIKVVPVFAIGVLVGSHYLLRSLLKAAKAKANLLEKMEVYRSALIVKYSLLGGPSLLSLIAYFLSGDVFFIGLTGVIIVILLTMRPTIKRAVRDLDLNLSDKQAINDPNRVIAEIEITK
jgi:hypothetical protein